MSVVFESLAPGKSLSVIVEDRHGGDLAVLLFDGTVCEPAVVSYSHRGCFEEFLVTVGSITDRVRVESDQDRWCSCGDFAAGHCCVHLRLADRLRADGHV